MANGLSIDVQGVPELNSLLTELAGAAAERAIAKGVIAAAEVFQEAITEAAPVRTETDRPTSALPPGKLKSSIQIRLLRPKNGTVRAFIEPSRETRHVARFVEFGHRLVKGDRSTKNKRGGYTGSGKQIGFVPAHPFVRPAFESSEGGALDAAIETTIEELTVEAEKLGLR